MIGGDGKTERVMNLDGRGSDCLSRCEAAEFSHRSSVAEQSEFNYGVI